MSEITFNQVIRQLIRHKDTGVVTKVLWRYDAVRDGNIIGSHLGEIDLKPPVDAVLPFENVQFQHIANWVVEAVGGIDFYEATINKLQADLLKEINNRDTASNYVAVPPPWI